MESSGISYLLNFNVAWEDPGLLGECPARGEELKFNPFIAGEMIDLKH